LKNSGANPTFRSNGSVFRSNGMGEIQIRQIVLTLNGSSPFRTEEFRSNGIMFRSNGTKEMNMSDCSCSERKQSVQNGSSVRTDNSSVRTDYTKNIMNSLFLVQNKPYSKIPIKTKVEDLQRLDRLRYVWCLLVIPRLKKTISVTSFPITWTWFTWTYS